MDNAIDDIGGIGMGGRMAGFETAALINRDIDQHGAFLHGLEHVGADQLGRGGSGDQHGADDEVRVRHAFSEIGTVGKAGLGPCLEIDAEPLQHFGAAVEYGHVRAEARRHLRRVEADDPAADDADLGREHAGHAAEQHAPPAIRLFQRRRARLNRHAPGYLTHRL